LEETKLFMPVKKMEKTQTNDQFTPRRTDQPTVSAPAKPRAKKLSASRNDSTNSEIVIQNLAISDSAEELEEPNDLTRAVASIINVGSTIQKNLKPTAAQRKTSVQRKEVPERTDKYGLQITTDGRVAQLLPTKLLKKLYSGANCKLFFFFSEL